MTVAPFLLALIAIFAAAKLFGEIAGRLGQPAVLGELIGGALVGVSGLRLVNPSDATIHLLAQLGVGLDEERVEDAKRPAGFEPFERPDELPLERGVAAERIRDELRRRLGSHRDRITSPVARRLIRTG